MTVQSLLEFSAEYRTVRLRRPHWQQFIIIFNLSNKSIRCKVTKQILSVPAPKNISDFANQTLATLMKYNQNQDSDCDGRELSLVVSSGEH